MSSTRRRLDGSTFLRNLADEIGRLADISDQAQRPAGGGHANTPDMERVRHFMFQVQTLDTLSQNLRDLQRLAGAAADACDPRHAVDADFVRSHVVLQSLADRLINGADQPAEPTCFLL